MAAAVVVQVRKDGYKIEPRSVAWYHAAIVSASTCAATPREALEKFVCEQQYERTRLLDQTRLCEDRIAIANDMMLSPEAGKGGER